MLPNWAIKPTERLSQDMDLVQHHKMELLTVVLELVEVAVAASQELGQLGGET